MVVVAKYPDSTKTSLEQRLRARARERWPQITSLQIRHRGTFSYIDATLVLATSLFGDVPAALREHGSATLDEQCCYFRSPD